MKICKFDKIKKKFSKNQNRKMSLLKQKSCKICKDKFLPERPLQMVCSFKCSIEYSRKQRDKNWKEKKRDLKVNVYTKENKQMLQSEINKLARQIDSLFYSDCICCGKSLKSVQVHGGHFHNVGGNENIRFNLHNIHAVRNDCNRYSSEHKKGYDNGLEARYGANYYDFVKNEIGIKYKELKLSAVEIVEKIKIVRKLNRDFETFTIESPIKAREMFNKIIGCYLE